MGKDIEFDLKTEELEALKIYAEGKGFSINEIARSMLISVINYGYIDLDDFFTLEDKQAYAEAIKEYERGEYYTLEDLEKDDQINYQLDSHLVSALNKTEEETGKSKVEIINTLIEQLFDKGLIDIDDVHTPENQKAYIEAMEEYKNGEYVTAEEIIAKYGK